MARSKQNQRRILYESSTIVSIEKVYNMRVRKLNKADDQAIYEEILRDARFIVALLAKEETPLIPG